MGSRSGGRLQSCGMWPDVVGEAESKPSSVTEVVKGLFGGVEARYTLGKLVGVRGGLGKFWTNDPGDSC